ncbi:MAG: acetate kinase [Oscillospiraceae bacterium]|nr:acetate kinase [Oscillospiraceae bacterium]
MKVLVINAGSSSLKYQLIDMATEEAIAKGLCERIGMDGKITHKTSTGVELSYEVAFPTHKEAFEELTKVLTSGEGKVIESLDEVSAIGHRAVHGGEKFSSSVIIDEEMMQTMDDLADLAPLHNPPGLTGMRACKEVFGEDVPMVGVFDTAFHQTMPAKAYIYPIPYEYYEKYRIRRYGFHGTSHRFVSNRLAEITGKKDMKVITCHLGNGSSIAAVDCGKVMETTMGLSPLEGLIMGTRSGNIDPTIVSFLADKEGMTAAEVVNMLNKKSGYQGVSGFTSDQRDLEKAAAEGNERAALAVEIQKYQIKKFVGGYAAAMGGVDAIVFTGSIGENDASVRADVCAGMEWMGLKFNAEANNVRGKETLLSTEDSKVQVWLIPTNEELMIARDTRDIVEGK